MVFDELCVKLENVEKTKLAVSIFLLFIKKQKQKYRIIFYYWDFTLKFYNSDVLMCFNTIFLLTKQDGVP